MTAKTVVLLFILGLSLFAQTVKLSYQQGSSQWVQTSAAKTAEVLQGGERQALLYKDSKIYANTAAMYAVKQRLIHLAFVPCETPVTMGLANSEANLTTQMQQYAFVLVKQNEESCLFALESFWNSLDEGLKNAIKKACK